MDRYLIGVNEKGEPEVVLNPDLVYLDTSAWIDLFKSFARNKEKLIDQIANAVNNNTFRLFLSVSNFLEMIATHGDVSENFSPEYLNAIQYIRITSAQQSPFIIDQEVFRFLDKKKFEVKILDPGNVALDSMIEGFEERKKGNTEWFKERRKWFDEAKERDRVLDLEADIYEQSGVIQYPSFFEYFKSRGETISGPIEEVKKRRLQLGRKKQKYTKKRQPVEEDEILLYAGHRISISIAAKYGAEKLSMILTNPFFRLLGKDDIVRSLKRGAELTLPVLREELPGLYWQSKIAYYNHYRGSQRAGGQLGDRQHAVYIPYCNYFATSDKMLVKALETEYSCILTKNNLHLFQIK